MSPSMQYNWCDIRSAGADLYNYLFTHYVHNQLQFILLPMSLRLAVHFVVTLFVSTFDMELRNVNATSRRVNFPDR